MRILHTSDWHLGRSFHREGMLAHQAAYVDHLLEVVEVGTSSTTACSFGGPDLSTLYVTTSTQAVPPGQESAAGALFAHEAGVAGVPVLPYAG